MVGLVTDRRIQNYNSAFPKVKTDNSDIKLICSLIFFFATLAITYIYFPNVMLEYDYKIESLKQSISKNEREIETKKIYESALVSPGRLEALAQKLGLIPPDISQVSYVNLASGPITDNSKIASIDSARADNQR